MDIGDSARIEGCQLKARYIETSSGNSSIDELFGGGLPNSSIITLDEMSSKCYAPILAKYFLAEGKNHGHQLVVAGPGNFDKMDQYLKLPSLISNKDSESSITPSTSMSRDADDETMRIAWRYANTPQVESTVGKQKQAKNRYDLGKTEELQKENDFRLFYVSPEFDVSYQELYQKLQNLLQEDDFSKTKTERKIGKPLVKKFVRVVIDGMGLPIWKDDENFERFLAFLPNLTRNAYVIVYLLTNPSRLSEKRQRALEIASDGYIRLQAIEEEERKTMGPMDKFHGYFRIIKLPRLSAAGHFCPPVVDLVFELHRKSFDVKILHLPPAVGEDEVKAKNRPGQQMTLSCQNKDLEF
ncbi:hypothetical protein WR25_14286 [Diploscapter pachys]|uniref:Elongator complex protein 4 n=1 Tax=Diploscapter pachys TaxID=2018661 RepID=A0A2A2KH07_9BILA|nr:hypothetical protein WR25_14286 [Diploscapter pachys]